jgi:hypothetical protein
VSSWRSFPGNNPQASIHHTNHSSFSDIRVLLHLDDDDTDDDDYKNKKFWEELIAYFS